MNRRDFLQRASAMIAAATIDPELLIWQPGKKTFFLPPTVIGAEVWVQLFNGNIIKSLTTTFVPGLQGALNLGDYVSVFESEVHRAKGSEGHPITGAVIRINNGGWLK